MEPIITYALIMFIGACMAVLIPYMLNRWKDETTAINWAYVAIIIISTMLAVFLGLPSKVDVIDMDAIKAAFAMGYAMQAVIGKIAKTILESKEQSPETII